MLSDADIRSCLRSGEIVIDPFDERLLKRNSYLLQLGGEFRRLSGDRVFDTALQQDYEDLAGEVFLAPSAEINTTSLVLAVSAQKIAVAPNLVGVLSGISNIARLGVLVHATSAFVNAGFGMPDSPGRVVFELATVGGRRVRLHEQTPICHLAFLRTETPSSARLSSARTGQDGPDPSRLLEQFGQFFAPD